MTAKGVIGGTLVMLPVLLAAACASTPATGAAVASGGRARTAEDYYPLQPGWKWGYDIETGGETGFKAFAVLERTADTAILQAGDERITYAITAAGIAQKEGGTLGDFVLKNPVVLGNEWPVADGTAKVAAVDQTVTVPTGSSYSGCVVVETLRLRPPRLSRTTYAPDVGWVLLEVQVQVQGYFVTTLRAGLRALTKPGQDPLAYAPEPR